MVVSINYAAIATFICVVGGYPVAYFIGKAPDRWRNLLLMMVMIPFWTNFLVRTYAWVTILRSEGVLNSLLINLGVIATPLDLYPSSLAVMIGLVYTYLPFMILPIYGSVERLDNAVVEAALDLGASPLRAFQSVIMPLTRPGVVAGVLLVFVPAVGMFAVNDILGGRREILIGNMIEDQFNYALNRPFGATLGTMLLVMFVLVYFFATRRRKGAV
jgi:spermidine/putrescine transport system permease protein